VSFKIGLALGGGAARGLAHIGVLKALQDARIPIDIITGTSIGAVIGSIYADKADAYSVMEKIDAYLHSTDFKRTRLDFIKNSDNEVTNYFGHFKKIFKTSLFFAVSLKNSSFISEKSFKSNLECIIPQRNIEDAAVKLGLVSMDLESAEEIVFHSGKMIDRVMASCAIPGIFPPFNYGKRYLIDGSWVNPVPVDLAKSMGANFIIAADVNPVMSHDVTNINGWNIIIKSSEASRIALKKCKLSGADIVIPIDLMDIHWADFLQLKKCIAVGEKTTIDLLPEIKNKLFWKKMIPRFPL